MLGLMINNLEVNRYLHLSIYCYILRHSRVARSDIFSRATEGVQKAIEEFMKNPMERIIEDLLENVAEKVIEEVIVIDPFNELGGDEERKR